METLRVRGGNPLHGEIQTNGAKNAAVAIIPAALLVDGVCRIENVPDIRDVGVILEMLSYLGAKVTRIDNNTIEIDSSCVSTFKAPYDLASRMRASYYLLGALLGRFGKAEVALPGGCNFGERPIDLHVKGFKALGATVDIIRGQVEAKAEELKGANVYLDKVSVGATMNIILAATLARGRTVIENAAKEPHIVDLANFLNAMGARIRGAGTDVIRIDGVAKLGGGSYAIIPDQIEAGTFMIMAAAAGGDVLVKNIIPKHMASLVSKLEEMGVEIEEYDDAIRVRRTKPLLPCDVRTMPYPGFPTDLQPQIVALLTLAEGTSMVTEDVWDNRFQYVGELKRLGADISVQGKTAIIEGGAPLHGAPVRATDLRAGAALIIAGLASDGITTINDPVYIDRGYENIEGRLTKIGAEIERVYISNG
ncbi:MAG: UDP-N-acetylglucosamine 1-carboxyvinyltransferase [Clostridia bacterium]|nr:UDP-N-acetylglucosamine 1-carboxyvinyltransferase [Clostridia bacterium]